MYDISIIIPAREENIYNKEGDLAPFGDTTLLEWKISQCKELVDSSNIFITSPSDKIKEICKIEGVNFIKRDKGINFEKVITDAVTSTGNDNILWTNVNSPFMSVKTYRNIIEKFLALSGDYDSLVTSIEIKEYIFFKNNPLNFDLDSSQTLRKDLKPILQLTNGCYLAKKEIFLKQKRLFGKKPFHFLLDSLESIEIKNIQDYFIANDLITLFFKKLIT